MRFGVGDAVVVVVLAGKDAVGVVLGGGPEDNRPMPRPEVGIAVVVVVVLHEAAAELLLEGERLAAAFDRPPAPARRHVPGPGRGAAALPVPPAQLRRLAQAAEAGPAVGILPMLDAARVLPTDPGPGGFPGAVDPPQGPSRPAAHVQPHPVQVRQVLHVAGGADPGPDPGGLADVVAADDPPRDQPAAGAPEELLLVVAGLRLEEADHVDAVVVAHQGLHLGGAHVGLAAQVVEHEHRLVAVGPQLPGARRQRLHPAQQLRQVHQPAHVLAGEVALQVENVGEAGPLVLVHGAQEPVPVGMPTAVGFWASMRTTKGCRSGRSWPSR